MNPVRNIVKSIGSKGLSTDRGTEPKPDVYRCRNCGRDVDPAAEACANCSSTNLRPLFL